MARAFSVHYEANTFAYIMVSRAQSETRRKMGERQANLNFELFVLYNFGDLKIYTATNVLYFGMLFEL